MRGRSPRVVALLSLSPGRRSRIVNSAEGAANSRGPRILIEASFRMGIYTEYIEMGLNFEGLNVERKKQLQRISDLRGGRDVLVYAADLTKTQLGSKISITYEDILPFSDQLSNLRGTEAIDIILETPGGSGEVAEQVVKALRGRYQKIGMIIPGWAKSAGTIMAMAADEILMDESSALGPIDAQIQWQGKVFSAEALLEGFRKIKKATAASKSLNLAYVPILQGISPGELQNAKNALKFARDLVTDWLVRYKFREWNTHSSTKQPVTPEERKQRAAEIAADLCSHTKWQTHGRSIQIDELRKMRLIIEDYSESAELADAIRRYHVLMQMTFQQSNVHKLFETPTTHLFRMTGQSPLNQPQPPAGIESAPHAMIDADCPSCGKEIPVQARFDAKAAKDKSRVQFPKDNKLRCPNCHKVTDVLHVRRQLEVAAKRPIL